MLDVFLNTCKSIDICAMIVRVKDFSQSVVLICLFRRNMTGVNRFRYDFSFNEFEAQKYLYIKGFQASSTFKNLCELGRLDTRYHCGTEASINC